MYISPTAYGMSWQGKRREKGKIFSNKKKKEPGAQLRRQAKMW